MSNEGMELAWLNYQTKRYPRRKNLEVEYREFKEGWKSCSDYRDGRSRKLCVYCGERFEKDEDVYWCDLRMGHSGHHAALIMDSLSQRELGRIVWEYVGKGKGAG